MRHRHSLQSSLLQAAVLSLSLASQWQSGAASAGVSAQALDLKADHLVMRMIEPEVLVDRALSANPTPLAGLVDRNDDAVDFEERDALAVRKEKTTSSKKKSTSTQEKKKTTSTKKKTTSTKKKTTSSTKHTTSSKKKTTTSSSSKHTTSTKHSTSTSTSTSTSKTTSTKHTSSTSTKTTTTKATSTSTKTTTTSTSSTTTTSKTAVTTTNTAAWSLVGNYTGESFFDDWTFWHWTDPTHGTVDYLNQSAAFAADLAYVNSDGQAVIAVDSTNDYANGTGRPSVRLHSADAFPDGLVLFDVAHVPVGCSVWPAMWMNGPDWPDGGEIDVFEGVGNSTRNTITLHTTDGCTADAYNATTNDFSGILVRDDCVSTDNGCSIEDAKKAVSYGGALNDLGGAIFAARFDYTGVTVWTFPRDSIPDDVAAGNPDPDDDDNGWPIPVAKFPSDSCTYDQYFGNQTLIINITLCGDWAGSEYVYGIAGQGEAGCPGTCDEYVMTGSHFTDAYFTINSVKIFRQL